LRTDARKLILDGDSMRRSISRMAHEIVEAGNPPESLALIGIFTRGVPLARRLANLIEQYESGRVYCGELDVTFYRDDLPLRRPSPSRQSDLGFDLTDLNVVLVDDVIFTGRTIRAALDALMDFGRPRRAQLAVLVDRGHRELPIRADFVGKNLPTSLDEKVVVHVEEVDGEDAVYICGAED
jgi:pyrimidine operon attenuation protein/uracil phosphoribosyltransferase